jgi:predicted DsbA family dithiol-disulfide isomerase
MKVEIWSDVMCPFCYIGKHQFEKALSDFEGQDNVEITWRSFELNPTIQYQEGYTLTQYLSDIKGMDKDAVAKNFDRLTEQGAQIGIDFRFNVAKVVNSRKSHKLIQAAKQQNLQNEIEETLFHAYFTEGKNLEDNQILAEIAKKVGIHFTKIEEILESNELEEAVNADVYMAQQVGARGVPFFVFDDAYAISGAHGADTFLNVLRTVELKSKQQV